MNFISEEHRRLAIEIFLRLIEEEITRRTDYANWTEEKKSRLVGLWIAAVQIAEIPFTAHEVTPDTGEENQ